jgi:predicted PurR-regulated permease PerM
MPPRRDLTRTTFAVLSLTALVGVSLWILRIFIGPAIWATMFVVASWPLMLRVERRLGHRVGAVALMTALLLLVFMLPLLVAVGTIVGNADELVGWARALASFRMPAAPPASIRCRRPTPRWGRCCARRRWTRCATPDRGARR